MEDRRCCQFFRQPQGTFQRRYEALRAIFVDGEALTQVAERFGYKISALRSIACRFRAECRRGDTPPFFVRMGEGDPRGRDTVTTGTAPRPQTSPTADTSI
jgi:hypothetical protein